jgi:hypothetical protein
MSQSNREHFVKLFTIPGDIVLNLFLSSGTEACPITRMMVGFDYWGLN